MQTEDSHIKAAVSQIIKVRRRLLESCGQLGFPSKLVDAIQPGVAVHADRRLGKTKALLWTIYERHLGEAILVVLNGQHERKTMEMWTELTKDEKQFPIHDPKIMMSPRAHHSIRGGTIPVYCDEWFKISPEVADGLKVSGRLAGAVGSLPNGNGIEVFPL